MLHDGYISLNPGTGKSSDYGSGESESERSDETLVDPARRESGFGLISTLTNGSHPDPDPQSHAQGVSTTIKPKETLEDAISLRLTAISHKLLELQKTSRDTVQGENPDSGRWVVDLLGGGGHQHDHDHDSNKRTWVHYRRPDEETLLARVDLRGLPVGSAEQDKEEDKADGKGETEHVEVFLLHEPSTLGLAGPNVQVGDGPRHETGERGETEWKLFDVRLVPSHPSADGASEGAGWVSDLADMPISARGGLAGDEVEDGYGDGDGDGWGSDVREDDGEGEAGVGGDDFWGGYDDDEDDDNEPDSPSKTGQTSGSPNVKPNPPHSSIHSVSFSHPVPEPEDDPYWQSYNSVEDGLRPSNPPTPGVRSPGGFGYGTAYGTGHASENEMGTEGYYGMTTSSGSDARLGGGARTPGREKDYWGTGGETPVGW